MRENKVKGALGFTTMNNDCVRHGMRSKIRCDGVSIVPGARTHVFGKHTRHDVNSAAQPAAHMQPDAIKRDGNKRSSQNVKQIEQKQRYNHHA